ncbi:hypothetical protein [Bosea sp. (in: a-proteobacteria)]|uniref:hypothetical protein n=1 Tax=Bosea sp. (in: a-proteobacteria) TaxID=1871050 RepID=UPI0026075B6B|nr:hypothetical protein [Bosea sp. (in: a-proteobacteria)]MCO5091817.1 hypothetical protein [Bosea sp. (in: a-proteobacteria)]
MIRMFSTFAVAGLTALAMGNVSQAQERTARRILSGPPAAIHGAMTEAQARKSCQMQMRGARESRASINRKMRFCINQKMNGN